VPGGPWRTRRDAKMRLVESYQRATSARRLTGRTPETFPHIPGRPARRGNVPGLRAGTGVTGVRLSRKPVTTWFWGRSDGLTESVPPVTTGVSQVVRGETRPTTADRLGCVCPQRPPDTAANSPGVDLGSCIGCNSGAFPHVAAVRRRGRAEHAAGPERPRLEGVIDLGLAPLVAHATGPRGNFGYRVLN
jgi:hypothetical protein